MSFFISSHSLHTVWSTRSSRARSRRPGGIDLAPKTWGYLESHAAQLEARGSSIYIKNPRFSIFGVGEYAFRPWRIAICGLYKKLSFRLVAPMDGRPVMFDDTVYYVSFDTEDEARAVLSALESPPASGLLDSLIFWDEKRPIKTAILNLLDWSKLLPEAPVQDVDASANSDLSGESLPVVAV